MAILKPFECTVEVDGVALEEYEDEDTEQANTTTSLTKYVEASSGANFSIKFTIQPGWTMKADYITWSIFLDGTPATGGVVPSEIYNGDRSVTSQISGINTGAGVNWTIRKFRFADITIGDNPDDLTPEEVKKRYEKLGNIVVEIWRMKLLRKLDYLQQPGHDALGVVPEKALKGQALSLSTELGPSEPQNRNTSVWSGEKLESYPVATFQFKYRSREALKQLLVIPRTPSPTPLEERNPEDLTPEEARELIRRQKSRLTEVQAIKKEEKFNKRDRSSTIGSIRPTKVVRTASGHSNLELDDSSDDVQIVKVESRSARKSRPPAETEVIDLLD